MPSKWSLLQVVDPQSRSRVAVDFVFLEREYPRGRGDECIWEHGDEYTWERTIKHTWEHGVKRSGEWGVV
jgi:hypothetical protein